MDRAMQQVEIDIERHVLTQTKKLSDNCFEKIFSRNPRNETRMFTYNCHLCGVASLPGERALQVHITGKKHQQRLLFDYVPEADQFRAPIAPKAKPIASFYPSEVPPPGCEDEVTRVTYLETVGNKQSKPLIGMEYVVELIDSKAKEPFYICILCDKRCDPRNIMPQITSHRHRMKYLDFHFPSIMKVLNLDHKFNVDMTYREEVLTAIATKIETKFKRSKPTVYDYNMYEIKKAEVNEEIRKKKHFSESDWPESEKVLLENVKISTATEYDNLSSDSEGTDFNSVRPSTSKSHVRKFKDIAPSQKVSSAFNRINPSTKSEPRKILTPRELNEQSNAKMQEKYIFEKYKASVEIAVKELEKKFKEYEKNPENHPQYSEEWKSFWSRRYKELLAQGKDANGHDYKPEWIEFWTKRMKDLLKIDIDKKKESFRKMLGLSIDAVTKIESTLTPSTSRERRSRSRSPRNSRRRKRSESPIKISDDSDDEHRNSKRYRTEQLRKSEERSRSRFSEDSPYSRQSEYRSRDAYEGYYTSRNRENERMRSKSPEIIDDGPVNLVSVCRLLSALEPELGLLAKAVIELLAKAVGLEKLKPNAADELLLNSENCNTLETVKEKLKGILTANILPNNKTIAVKRAIKNIATLLHDINSRKPLTSISNVIPKQSEGQKSFNDQSFDDIDPVASAKYEIAKVITESLIAQGRSDFTAEELEALVESFMETAANEEEEEEVPAPKAEKLRETKPEPKPSFSTAQPSPHSTKPHQKQSSSNGGPLENLTDEDLQTLLRNFADLTSDEQSHLIAHLSKIEKTNPSRVERLRKFVNIGDNDDYDEDIRDVDMDLAAGVDEPKPVSSRKKSPAQTRHELSDDDYDDDAMAKQIGMNASSSLGESSRQKSYANGSGTNNIIKDSSGLADSLMSSLLQSSLPVQQTNRWDFDTKDSMSQQTSPAFYQQSQASHYQNMVSANMFVQQQMNTNHMAMGGMQMPLMPADTQWPQSAASNFYREVEIPSEYSNKNHQDKAPFKKRYENPNNRQLTGKGKRR